MVVFSADSCSYITVTISNNLSKIELVVDLIVNPRRYFSCCTPDCASNLFHA